MNPCQKIKEVKISVNSVKGKCKYNYSSGQEIDILDIYSHIDCLALSHTLFAYHLTFSKKGWFPWIKKREGVLCHCPHPRGLAMGVFPRVNKVFFKVHEKGICRLNVNIGQEVEIKMSNMCYKAFDNLFPYILSSSNNKNFLVSCPNHKDYVVFSIK